MDQKEIEAKKAVLYAISIITNLKVDTTPAEIATLAEALTPLLKRAGLLKTS